MNHQVPNELTAPAAHARGEHLLVRIQDAELQPESRSYRSAERRPCQPEDASQKQKRSKAHSKKFEAHLLDVQALDLLGSLVRILRHVQGWWRPLLSSLGLSHDLPSCWGTNHELAFGYRGPASRYSGLENTVPTLREAGSVCGHSECRSRC